MRGQLFPKVVVLEEDILCFSLGCHVCVLGPKTMGDENLLNHRQSCANVSLQRVIPLPSLSKTRNTAFRCGKYPRVYRTSKVMAYKFDTVRNSTYVSIAQGREPVPRCGVH